MGRGQLRLRALSAAAALALAALACDQAVGEGGPWEAWDTVTGAELLQPTAPPPPPDSARIVSWNVEFGGAPLDLAAAIRADPELAGAQVILVQEIESYPGEDGSRASRLAGALGLGYVYIPARPEGDGTHGLAILSALPFEAVRVKRLPRVELPGPNYDRIAVAAELAFAGRTVRFVNVHLDTRISVTDRLVQLRPAVIDAPAAAVVGGDFNMMPYLWAEGAIPLAPVDQVADTEQAPVIDAFMTRLGFATPTADLGPTQSSLLLGELRLDALYPRGLAPGRAGVERGIDLSDHWPLWLDVAVQPE